MELKTIAYMKSDFPTKFGLPRQSGLVEELRGKIVFEKEYAVPEAVRGLEGFSHIWLLWGFSEAEREKWSPTVRPPRLGGNIRMGVFATRSPFRPNPIGLSCVKLDRIVTDGSGIVLEVSGADLMDGTPIYDIKPYLPFADAYPEASGGFASPVKDDNSRVSVANDLLEKLPEDKRAALVGILKENPKPRYQNDEREYGFIYAGYEIKFKSCGDMITVTSIEKQN